MNAAHHNQATWFVFKMLYGADITINKRVGVCVYYIIPSEFSANNNIRKVKVGKYLLYTRRVVISYIKENKIQLRLKPTFTLRMS